MIRSRPAGGRAVVLDLEEGAEPAATAAAVRLLAAQLGVALAEVVPGAQSVLVATTDRAGLQQLLAALPRLPDAPAWEQTSAAVLELPARYDGPDLDHVARATGLTVDQVVHRHSAVVYRAAFSGFAPGFTYLSGLDPVLRLPRRETPRTAVPAGALAVADGWTAVYPRRTPGGWHLIGTVAPPVFDLQADPPSLLGPGRRVRFVPSS